MAFSLLKWEKISLVFSSDMAPIKVGFVGYGGSVRTYHLPYIVPNKEFEIYAFLQRSPAPSRSPSETVQPGNHCTVDFPAAKHYRTADDFFADTSIEVVIVCTRTDTHAEFAEKALRAGKNVVVEKPFTRSTDEADRLIALAKEKRKILTVYQNRRWDGDFQTLRHLVEHRALGKITEAEIHYDLESPPWIRLLSNKKYSPGAGLMFGIGSHTIDQALLLFGRPTSVTGFLKVWRGIESEVEDTFTIILQYEGPLLVTVKTTISTCMVHQLKYFVRGSEGSYIKYGSDVQEEQTLSGMSSEDPQFGVEPESQYGLLTTYSEFDGKSQSYNEQSKKYSGKFPTITGYNRGYYEHIADMIRRGAAPKVAPQTSRDGIRVMELARKSYETGTVVPWS